MVFSCLQEENNPAYETHTENLLSTNGFLIDSYRYYPSPLLVLYILKNYCIFLVFIRHFVKGDISHLFIVTYFAGNS